MIDNSSTTELCNITLEETDMKKLEELDPNQVNGMRTYAHISVPVLIKYVNELSEEISD